MLERSNTLDDTFESLGQSVFGDGYDATSNISLLDPLGESTAGAELSDDSDASIDELGTSRDIESWTFDTQLTSTPSKKATFQDVQHLSHVFATPRACRSVRECLMGKPICLYMYSYHTQRP